ncbi:MAG: prepilin-type N-terminal cleavage/methylation domain-containing protein [Bacilli bacterium]
MKKNGFTLVELLISLALLSIVLVFMMSALVDLRDEELKTGKDTSVLLNQAFISKAINHDVVTSSGISSINCPDTFNCNIIFNNNISKKINLSSDKTTLSYTTPSDNTVTIIKKLPDGYTYKSMIPKTDTKLKELIIKVEGKSIGFYDIEIFSY